MIRILHLADLHLDTPFSLYSGREAERRRTELRSDLSSVSLLIRKAEVQICLISGDLFDSGNVTKETAERLQKELASCPDCRFFISAGNHDSLSETSPYATLDFPPNVHIFGPEKECVHLDDLGADVYGFSFDGSNGNGNPLTGYPEKDASRINLLCVHGELGGRADSPNAPFTQKDLGECGFDYVALGHIHKGTGLQCENGVYWAYPGCIEGRGFDEPGYKGVLLGNIEKGKAELQFVRIAKRRYEIAECDISGLERVDAIEKLRALARPYGEDTALRIILTGEVKTPLLFLPEEIGLPPEYPYAIECKDETVLAPDLTELEQSSTLKGVFYRMMKEKIENGEADELALRYGLLALDGRSVIDFSEE